jgi:hypothetical protein
MMMRRGEGPTFSTVLRLLFAITALLLTLGAVFAFGTSPKKESAGRPHPGIGTVY